MTISYIENENINNLSNIKFQETNFNIQYNSDFISKSEIDLNITNYSIYIIDNKILIWNKLEEKGVTIEAQDLVFHAISSSDNNAEREGNFPYLYVQILVNESSLENLNSLQSKEFEEFINAVDSIEIYIISQDFRKIESLYEEISNLINNYDDNVKNADNKDDDSIGEDDYKDLDAKFSKFKNGFEDVLIQLTSDNSLNPKEWYFGDVPFENIHLTTEGQAISDRLEKMLDINGGFENLNADSYDIERKETESEDGQFDSAEED